MVPENPSRETVPSAIMNSTTPISPKISFGAKQLVGKMYTAPALSNGQELHLAKSNVFIAARHGKSTLTTTVSRRSVRPVVQSVLMGMLTWLESWGSADREI